MRVKRYDADKFENGRPVPSDRPEDYTVTGLFGCLDGHPGRGITVSRDAGSEPTERYLFATASDPEREIGGWPATPIVTTPVKRETARVTGRAGEGVRVRVGAGGRESTRTDEIGLSDLPPAVRKCLELEDGVRLVESIHD